MSWAPSFHPCSLALMAAPQLEVFPVSRGLVPILWWVGARTRWDLWILATRSTSACSGGRSEEVTQWDGVLDPAYLRNGLSTVCPLPRVLQLCQVLVSAVWAGPFWSGMEPGFL